MSESMDEFKAAIDLYNSWPKLKQKEVESIFVSSLKSLAYYQQHPQKKEEFLQKLRILFEDWKKSRKEYDDYHNWCKGRELSLDEVNGDWELHQIEHKKWTEFFNQSMYYPGPEVKEMFLEVQKMQGDKK